jgi:hypothetical protein
MAEYRPIAGYPGYRVGDDGSVWCCRPINGRGPANKPWRRLNPWRNPKPNGGSVYSIVSLHGNGVHVARCVHLIVLESFIGPRPEGMQARHFPDRDTTNNRLDNLQWGTPKQNSQDRITHGTNAGGSRNGSAKLKEADIVVLRLRYFAALGSRRKMPNGRLAKIAKEFGVTIGHVCKIVRRRLWKNVS